MQIKILYLLLAWCVLITLVNCVAIYKITGRIAVAEEAILDGYKIDEKQIENAKGINRVVQIQNDILKRHSEALHRIFIIGQQ